MDVWHTGTGIIKYDPHRFGMKNKTEWWAIVNVDREITRYYRWWIKKHYWVDLCQPSWDAHISIIRGEKPKSNLEHLWKKYDGKHITFKYQHKVRCCNSKFWIVEVTCPFLTQIRNEFELPADWKFHITIGRMWY